MENKFRKELDKIEIPLQLRRKTELGIQKAKQELIEQKSRSVIKMKRFYKTTFGTIGAAAIAFTLLVVVEPGLASSVKGFFKDIVNWKGEVTGTEYHQATDEMKVESKQPEIGTEKVIVPITVTIPQGNRVPPYIEMEAITLGEFAIVGSSGDTLHAQKVTVQAITKKEYSFDIQDADRLLSETLADDPNNKKFQANLLIPKDFFERNSSLTLKITSFYGHKKADAPLEIRGTWEKRIK